MSAAVDALLRGIDQGKLATGDQAAVRVYFKGLDDSLASANAIAIPGATRAATVRRLVVDGDLAVPAGKIIVGPVAPTKGNVLIDSDGIRLRNYTTNKINLTTGGDIFIGSDLSAPGSTYFSIFSIQQTYNSENFLAGDMLIGDNSASKANIKWDKANGQLDFRGGTSTTILIDTDGSLNLFAGASTNSNISWRSGSTTIGSIAGIVTGITIASGTSGFNGQLLLQVNSTSGANVGLITMLASSSSLGISSLARVAITQAVHAGNMADAGTPLILWLTGGAHTAQVAEVTDLLVDMNRTVQFTTASIPATQRAVRIVAPTYSASAATGTITTAVTLDIDRAPQAGANAAITTAYALRVVAGAVLLGGGLNVGTATGATAGVIFAEVTDAGTATQTLPIRVAHRSSGTPAAGFGNDINWRADSANNTLRSQGDVVSQWVVATDATRTARLSLFVDDSAASREFLRGEGSGTAAMIGFLGAAAVVKQATITQTYATTGTTLAADTASNMVAGGTGTAAGGWDTAAHRDTSITAFTNLRTDVDNVKNVLNSVIDALQAYGLMG